jgi:hypothetical protein
LSIRGTSHDIGSKGSDDLARCSSNRSGRQEFPGVFQKLGEGRLGLEEEVASVGTLTRGSSAVTSVSPFASRIRAAPFADTVIRCSSLNQSAWTSATPWA